MEALLLCADLGDDPSKLEIRAWLQKPLQVVKRIPGALVLYYEHSPLKGEPLAEKRYEHPAKIGASVATQFMTPLGK